MDTKLVIPSNEPHVSHKARIAKTWQQYCEDRGYGLWGFSPSPTARTLAEALLNSNLRRSERVEIVDWGADMDEIRSILLSWVSMSSVLTYRERLLPSRALLISSGKKVVFRLLEVPAFTLAICAPFLGAELDKEFAPSSPTEFFIC